MAKSENQAVMMVKYTINKRENNLTNVGLAELTARLTDLGNSQSEKVDIVLGVEDTNRDLKLPEKLKVWLRQLNQKYVLSIDETTEGSAQKKFLENFYDPKTAAAMVIHLIETAIFAYDAKKQQEIDNLIRSQLAVTLASSTPPTELGVWITEEKINAYQESRRAR